MAYYDIYDSNDNLIASEVWIDDGLGGGPTRPVVVNIRKVLMFIFAFVGFINTFALPIMLFINKDVFIDWGWLLASIPSIIVGLPTFVVFFAMLNTYNKVKKNEGLDEAILSKAKQYVNSKIEEEYFDVDDESISDEDYVKKMEAKFKFQTAVSRVYLTIKFERLLRNISYISYLVYPIGILSYVGEFMYGTTDTFMIILGIINYLVFLLLILSIYKNYKVYKMRYFVNAKKRMALVAVVTFALSVGITTIFTSAFGVGGFSILCVFAMLLDLAFMIDSKIKRKINRTKTKIHIGPIIVSTLIYGLLGLFVGCGLALIPGPMYDAIIAYDAGLSTDLTLPITVWTICGVITIALIVITSIKYNKKLNNKNK